MPPRPLPHLNQLPILPIGATSVPGVDRIVPLANNEICDPPGQAVKDAVAKALTRANFYPDIDYGPIRAAISKVYGVDPQAIALGHGSSELIANLAQSYCGPGDEVIIGRHGYLGFGIAALQAGATVVYCDPTTTDNQIRFDPDAALSKVTDKTRIVFLDNPSNPLGTYVNREALAAFRRDLREDILLILDAAYTDYADADDFDPGDDLVRTTRNTAVLRTFSKIYGLAGMRIGWAHAPQNLIDTLTRVTRPGDVAQVCAAAAETVLLDREEIARRKALNARLREEFSSRLRERLGFTVLPSQANFVLVTVPAHARLGATDLRLALEQKGVLVRSMDPYGLPDSLRVSIGSEEDMDIAYRAIEELQTA